MCKFWGSLPVPLSYRKQCSRKSQEIRGIRRAIQRNIQSVDYHKVDALAEERVIDFKTHPTSSYEDLREQLNGANLQLQKARREKEQEKEQRENLQSQSELVQVAGSQHFELTHVQLSTNLDDAADRQKNILREKEAEQAVLNSELNHLENIETLAVEPQLKRLLAHYYQLGISQGELKAFPEYLSTYYEDPQAIADLMERDPGRFTGMMAASPEALKKVQDLEVPPWLHKPIVLSLPPTEEVEPIQDAVIAPLDAKVYSKQYIEQEKERLRNLLKNLKQELEDLHKKISTFEDIARLLRDYQKRFPDQATLKRLDEKLEESEARFTEIEKQIENNKLHKQDLVREKEDLDQQIQTKNNGLIKMEGWLVQIQNWLQQYGKWEEWLTQLKKLREQKILEEEKIEKLSSDLVVWNDQKQDFKVKIENRKRRVEELEKQSTQVASSSQLSLSEEQVQAALSRNLDSLQKDYQEAARVANEKALDLGIENLQKEQQEHDKQYTEAKSQFDYHQRTYLHPPELAEEWSAQNKLDREQRILHLGEELSRTEKEEVGLEHQLQKKAEDIQSCVRRLQEANQHNIFPNLSQEELENENLEVLHHRCKEQKKEAHDAQEQFQGKVFLLKGTQEHLTQWEQEIRLVLSKTEEYEARWDSDSPRTIWPSLEEVTEDLYVDEGKKIVERTRQVGPFKKLVLSIKKEKKQTENREKDCQQNMSHSFDQLQTKLRQDQFQKQLPLIVDKLTQHTSDSLGKQSKEFLQRCDEVAQNLEGDLSRSEKFLTDLVDQLLQQAREYSSKLQAAARVKIPENVFIYGGRSILKAGTLLDFNKNEEMFQNSLKNWLEKLIQEKRIPAVNDKVGNVLGMELLYRLLETARAKKEFGIRLLKCDDNGKNYEPVGKDLGSGGEGLTTAVLLYTLLTAMRQKRRHQGEDRIPAFLIADNPLGVCNRADFLDAQLKVARVMGIQCIYFTGIHDQESLALFKHRIAIRKRNKKLKIEDKYYRLLEIIEQNIEGEA